VAAASPRLPLMRPRRRQLRLPVARIDTCPHAGRARVAVAAYELAGPADGLPAALAWIAEAR